MATEGTTRRRVLQTAGSAVVGGAILEGATPVSAQSSEAWPQFGYDAANTGYASNNTGPVKDIQQQWRFQTESTGVSPPVVDGTVYVGSTDGTVYALNTAEGTEQWTFQANDEATSSPAVVDSTVYLGSADGRVYALDAAEGTEQWSAFPGPDEVTSPVVADGTVYLGSTDGSVYALDARKGTEQWTFRTNNDSTSRPAVVDGTVYVGSSRDVGEGVVHALDSADGTEQWNAFPGPDEVTSPVVADGTVYLGSTDGSVYALDARKGIERWRSQTGEYGGTAKRPAVTESTVYVPNVSGTLYAIDAARGTERWRFNPGGEVTSPAVADSTVYLGSTDGHAYALDAADGTEQWNASPAPSAVTSLAVADGTVYVESGGSVYALTGSSPSVGGSGGPVGRLPDVGGIVSLLSVLGVAGAGGVGTWLYRRSGDTGDSGAPTSGRSSLLPESLSTGSSRRINRQQDTQIPAEIPRAPEVSVEYDALTDREPIGSGGNADVTKATLSTPNGDVTLAIKRPRMAGTLHIDTVERMLQEAEIWAKLDDHDHIVGVIEYDGEPVPWIAMEYMDGGHLGERRDEMDLTQKLWTAIAVTKGIRHAHRRGVTHLDLKPENVLLRTVEDGWDVPKVADWGLSKHLLDHSNSIEGLSPHYAAPEQFDDSYGDADDLTDVYQLGAVFYELFTGRSLFEGKPAMVMNKVLNEEPTPPSAVADVPPELDDVLQPALAKQKHDRYESVLYLRDGLQDLFESL